MRYTTLIDIREWPSLYRNLNVRLVYLHLTLAAGYHDQNRDVIVVSIRQLAADVGITVAATRHALKMLTKVNLIKTNPSKSAILVRKWLSEQTVSKRTAAATSKKETDIHAHEHQIQPKANGREEIIRRAAAGDKASQELCKRLKWEYQAKAE